MTALDERLPKFRSIVTDEVVIQCSAFIRQVSDIPRLYRRTNREVRKTLTSYFPICRGRRVKPEDRILAV